MTLQKFRKLKIGDKITYTGESGNDLTKGTTYDVLEVQLDDWVHVLDDVDDVNGIYYKDTEEYGSGGYIKDALRTESTVFNAGDRNTKRLLHAGIGLTTEAGEFIDALKKSIFYGKPLDTVNLKEELGDLMWYIAIACDALDTDFDELQDTNINKLRLRYPEKFTKEKAEVRDLKAERELLENS